MFLAVVCKLPPRDRCLITAQWFTGFRISEMFSLKDGSVLRNGEVVSKIGVSPRNMKGGYNRTRWMGVHHPGHDLLVCADVQGWDVDVESDKGHNFLRVTARQSFQLALRQCAGRRSRRPWPGRLIGCAGRGPDSGFCTRGMIAELESRRLHYIMRS